MKLFRSKKRQVLLAFLVGTLLFGGSAGTAYAAASSDMTRWLWGSTACFEHQATSQNSAAVGKSGNGINRVVGRAGSSNDCTNFSATHSIGLAAFLKKTSGSVCASSGVAYANAQAITRYASYSSSSCGTGVQLQGSITSYSYNSSTGSYQSSSIAAPFQNY